MHQLVTLRRVAGRRLPQSGWVHRVGIAAASGVLLGVLCAWTSPAAVAIGLVALFTATIVIRRPEVGALAVICLTLVVPRDMLFAGGLTLGSGSLKLTDGLTILAVGAWLAHRVVDPGSRDLPSVPVSALLLSVFGVAVLAVVMGAERGNGIQAALTDFRPTMSLLLVFPLAAFVRNTAALRRALAAVVVACAVAAVWIVVLYLAGEGSASTYASGALRVTDVPFVAPLLGAIWALVLLPHARTTRRRIAPLALAVGCLAALFFTLQRAAWLALVLAVLFAAMLMTPRRRGKLIAWLAALLVASAAAIASVNMVASSGVENPFAGGLERIQSVGAFEEDVSALHRQAELREALDQVRSNPLTGIGMGGELRFFSPLYNPTTGRAGMQYATTYVHSSYTWLALKMGIPGLLLFAALLSMTLASGIRAAVRKTDLQMRAGALGCVVTVAALAAVSFTGPHLTSDLSVPYVAGVIAAIDVICRGETIPTDRRKARVRAH